MAFSYGFFNSKGLDRTYTAENFCDYLGSIICNGIQDNYGDCFSIISTDGISVLLGTGKAWINGHYFISDAHHSISLSEYMDESLPRYVAVSIVCDTSDDVRDVHLELTAGTPAENPTTVEFQPDDYKKRLILYNIRLNPGATSLSSFDWLDHRNDENICGYCKCILGKCKVTELMNDFQTYTQKTQELQQQVTDLMKVESEVQEYIEKTQELQEKVDYLYSIVKVIGSDIIDAGQCGDDVYYAIFSDGLLKLTGSGQTYQYTSPLGGDNPSPFAQNENITKLEIQDGITSIGDNLFYNTGVESVEIPPNIISVENSAFSVCVKLKTLKIESRNIRDMAFYGCSGLNSVTISTSVEILGISVFGECESLKNITYEGTISQWNKIKKSDEWSSGLTHENRIEKIQCTDGYLEYDFEDKVWYEMCISDYQTENSDTIKNYTGSAVNIEIPSKIEDLPVKKIGGGVFSETEVEKVKIPEGVEEIE